MLITSPLAGVVKQFTSLSSTDLVTLLIRQKKRQCREIQLTHGNFSLKNSPANAASDIELSWIHSYS